MRTETGSGGQEAREKVRPLELWVGVEPTVSRVQGDVQDQLLLSGFHHRLEDIDLLASLGASRVRFPLLWERTAPRGLDHADWSWADARLTRLASHGLEPIVGLVHHGGGPAHTNLLQADFAQGLADYARAVAERYPHVTMYTPVNEPLTTARFCALYGHWYPHARSDRSFWQALMHQLKATVLAMRAIREVQPEAQLVQTEDMGLITARPGLQAQADFENERRWLSFDLLLGRVDHSHPMWGYLRWAGASEADLRWFLEHPCPPGVVGLNAYVTSERFLDDRLELYPQERHGGNHHRRYVDVETVRVSGEGITGPAERLREAHARYGLPVALTEVHLACTREEQMRWLHETWHQAEAARADGVDVRAVTIWAALGAFDWNSLLTRRDGHYESGLWDVRAPTPRPTALVRLARQLSGADEVGRHPVLAGPGWWRRGERFTVPAAGTPRAAPAAGSPLLLLGADGELGQAFVHACAGRGLPCLPYADAALDPDDPRALEELLRHHRPWAVINATRRSPLSPDLVPEAASVAGACAAWERPLLTFSTPLVFDGLLGRPYVESDPTAPRRPDARGHLDAERLTLERHPGALVVRTGPLFSSGARGGAAARIVQALRDGRPVEVLPDEVVSPTYVPDLTHAALDLLIDGESGLWHLANADAVSRAEFARLIADAARLGPARIALPREEEGTADGVPLWSALGSERGWIMPSLSHALGRWRPD